ncbi:sigma factor-like helix-turn-helix DNA-binding protein [Lysinibacillus pakistanensis]|uniref:Sigma factor-like helix-turn-helix DNA-binding protein n=1 Tax=Lysinibacillus pakistanensis TaxID=759811 RepID=A0AAX3X2G2_9BACI|nr:sigma factor-like helix-turn-helix DNA-binding protein [Lysinibacillus pakistanensis]MDM5233363.1 sigma factor-like helix-turn-helix DNA-binding protein [Lysinibacillus pakistanensis]WHY48837.1 sigma factor-like helix-turn-helix DNA-binding protein [Lysinibacillus pakistanensis]WHY53849.1 sigma factor-like helix-turn-helix DNA-binding protein [Lysinibacillus pakistanensis]
MTKTILDELQRKREAIAKSDEATDNLCGLTPDEIQAVRLIEEDIKTMKYWLSNVSYGLQYMNLGHIPCVTRGIERRAAYEREIPFEPYWIQRRQATNDMSMYEVVADENADLVKVTQEEKGQILQAITGNLTTRQKDILQLISNGYTHEEIASVLGIHKGTVARTISRIKGKIEDEGWFIP